MALSTRDILLRHVCPGVGNGIALIMFASPLPAVLRAQREKSIGELNALPFAAMAINCTAWIFYAMLLRDFYIYCGNMPGVLFGLFYVLTCYKYSKEAAQNVLRNVLVGGCGLFWALGFASMAANLDLAANKTLWGATCVSVLGVYYTAPLTSVAKVIAERDSSSLHAPLSAMNVVNGMLWFAYGLALRDWFVALPNGIGAGFNVICVVLCFMFPARRRQAQQQQQQEQQQRGAAAVLGQLDPAANWGALRLQSFARRPGQPQGAAASSNGGGFFDVAQMRWRSGRVGSMLRSLSSSVFGSERRGGSRAQLQQQHALQSSSRGGSHSWKDAGGDHDGAGSDQLDGGGGAGAAAADRIKAGNTADDLEQQAAVVADSRAASPVLLNGGRDDDVAAGKGSRAS